MNARHLIIGCTLALGGLGAARAADVDDNQAMSAGRSTADAGTHDVAAAGAGDPATTSRDAGTRGNGGGDSDAGNAIASPASGGSQPPSPHRSSLGWQSLLPGSIQ